MPCPFPDVGNDEQGSFGCLLPKLMERLSAQVVLVWCVPNAEMIDVNSI